MSINPVGHGTYYYPDPGRAPGQSQPVFTGPQQTQEVQDASNDGKFSLFEWTGNLLGGIYDSVADIAKHAWNNFPEFAGTMLKVGAFMVGAALLTGISIGTLGIGLGVVFGGMALFNIATSSIKSALLAAKGDYDGSEKAAHGIGTGLGHLALTAIGMRFGAGASSATHSANKALAIAQSRATAETAAKSAAGAANVTDDAIIQSATNAGAEAGRLAAETAARVPGATAETITQAATRTAAETAANAIKTTPNTAPGAVNSATQAGIKALTDSGASVTTSLGSMASTTSRAAVTSIRNSLNTAGTSAGTSLRYSKPAILEAGTQATIRTAAETATAAVTRSMGTSAKQTVTYEARAAAINTATEAATEAAKLPGATVESITRAASAGAASSLKGVLNVSDDALNAAVEAGVQTGAKVMEATRRAMAEAASAASARAMAGTVNVTDEAAAAAIAAGIKAGETAQLSTRQTVLTWTKDTLGPRGIYENTRYMLGQAGDDVANVLSVRTSANPNGMLANTMGPGTKIGDHLRVASLSADEAATLAQASPGLRGQAAALNLWDDATNIFRRPGTTGITFRERVALGLENVSSRVRGSSRPQAGEGGPGTTGTTTGVTNTERQGLLSTAGNQAANSLDRVSGWLRGEKPAATTKPPSQFMTTARTAGVGFLAGEAVADTADIFSSDTPPPVVLVSSQPQGATGGGSQSSLDLQLARMEARRIANNAEMAHYREKRGLLS